MKATHIQMKGEIEHKYAMEVVRALPKRGWLRFLMASPQWVIITRIPWLAGKLFDLYMDERVIDYPFAHGNLGLLSGAKILDVGCLGSILPIELASLGHQVWGLDLGEYPLSHPNLTFVKGDATHMPFADGFFDAVVAISTIEHIGLGRYGDEDDSQSDRKAVEEIRRVLKPGGRLLLTVPFGRGGIARWRGINLHRAYNWESLQKLLGGLDIVDARFYLRRGYNWVPASLEEAQSAEALQVWNGFHPRVVGDCQIVALKPTAASHLQEGTG